MNKQQSSRIKPELDTEEWGLDEIKPIHSQRGSNREMYITGFIYRILHIKYTYPIKIGNADTL
ncbi:hypothetical protein GCM10010912_16430 [Paenibacillus albidus]|uniref:Uncharacterized protein n=1 Tax=Paenibacillus albidus TaxID=2041023 RepID=A0A917C5R0_9BACL|nr:hypothetical protein [Paenibacillus albidus]GGF72011.1 hypothetical protein GCM10010912_16430 [Paenibacillus albidus]